MISLLNDWAAAWAPWFTAALVQNTLWLLLVFLALYLLRRSTARILSLVATIGVVKLVIPPLFPSSWLLGEKAVGISSVPGTLLFPFAQESEIAAAEQSSSNLFFGGLDLATVIMLLWASIALTRLIWALVQTLDLTAIVSQAEEVPANLVPAEIRDRGVRVLTCRRVGLPFTLGIFPRRIFVPPAWQQWDQASRHAVLRHELAHIRRRDGLVQVLEAVAHAVFFFHPLVTLLIRRLRIWREMACDDFSVAGDASARLAYSHFLVHLAETALGPRPATESASTLARRKCELMKRVTYQVREKDMNNLSRTKLSMILIVLLAAMVPLSLALGEAPPVPPAKPAPVAEVAAAPAPSAEAAAPTAPTSDEKKKKTGKGEEMEVKKARGDVPPPPAKEYLMLKLTADGTMVNGEPAAPEKVKKILKKVASHGKEAPVIIIDSDGGVPMSEVHQIQKLMHKLELKKVKYKGALGQSLPMVLPPEKVNKKLAQLPDHQKLHIMVDGAGVVTIDGKKTKGAKVGQVVAKALQESPEMVVALHTEGDTTFGAFIQTLESLKKGGATRIAILDPKG
jgi:beta-lactamase regulating signal transducer with metallopeptidase domain/biopolymer transport protein ExbD